MATTTAAATFAPPKRRRRIAALLAATAAGALRLRGSASSNVRRNMRSATDADAVGRVDARPAPAVRTFRDMMLEGTAAGGAAGGSIEGEGEGDYTAATAAAFDRSEAEGTDHVDDLPPSLRPYTLEDALYESEMFSSTFALLVYSPRRDEFWLLQPTRQKWDPGDRKLFKATKHAAYLLRRTFPDRFTPSSPELVLAVAGGDHPRVKPRLMPRVDGRAPVWMFGSAFRDPDAYPNMAAMPLPGNHHLFCMQEFAESGRVCEEMRGGDDDGGGLEFGEEGAGWDDLIPQVVWRGTDFGYLLSLQPRPSLVRPRPSAFVRAVDDEDGARVEAVRALMAEYDALVPRWKAAALTAAAELEARARDRLPWADMKFSAHTEGKKRPAAGSAKYAAWESVGIGVGRPKSLAELSRYRYHVDLGGGGGTTWTGTIEKLALPGLLFHHVTPAKDYVHDRLRPWKHYVPVAADLRDLRSKFDWAEAHPVEARRIADAGTALARELGTPEGFGRMFEEDFREPMRRAIEAYRPVASVRPDAASWEEALHSIEDRKVLPVMMCSGIDFVNSCRKADKNDIVQWQKADHW